MQIKCPCCGSTISIHTTTVSSKTGLYTRQALRTHAPYTHSICVPNPLNIDNLPLLLRVKNKNCLKSGVTHRNSTEKNIFLESGATHRNYRGNWGESKAWEVNKFCVMWNRLPTPFKHKKVTTKLYAKLRRYFSQLQAGTMWKDKALDKEWLRARKLEQFLLYAWSDTEIMVGIRRLSKLYHKDEWPADKSRLPTNLAALFYNPYTKKSMFLLVMTTRLKKLEQKKTKAISSGFSIPDGFSI